MPGTLFIVGTPIGNLEDVTLRALRVLREVDLVAAEDTRRTAKLLAHYEIRKPLASFHAHNEVAETPRLASRLAAGESIALVTDAGTPGIADPGARLVRKARELGIPVIPVPGPSAVSAAISIAGLTSEIFAFMGFPPRSGTAREEWFQDLADRAEPVVLFEAPHRINRTLSDLFSRCGSRPIFVSREMTKKHEEYVDSQSSNTPLHMREQGEFVIVIGSANVVEERLIDVQIAQDLIGRITELAGLNELDAQKAVASVLGVPEGKLRKQLKKAAFSVKKHSVPAP